MVLKPSPLKPSCYLPSLLSHPRSCVHSSKTSRFRGALLLLRGGSLLKIRACLKRILLDYDSSNHTL